MNRKGELVKMKTLKKNTDKRIRSAFLYILALAVIIPVLVCSVKLTADAGSSKMIITAIDLGKENTGDATMITDQNGKALLVDSGDNHNRSIFAWLDRHGYKKKKFDTLVTHWHDDHAGNTAEIIRKYNVGTVYIPPLTYVKKHNTAYYRYERTYVNKTLAAAKARGTKVVYLKKGMKIKVGGVTGKVLYICGSPESESWYDIMYFNNNSAAIMFEGGGAKLLLSGDLMQQGEKRLVNSGQNIKADIFQLNHHGYDGSNNKFFLDKVDPAFAWFSNYHSTPSKYSDQSISNSVSRIGRMANTFSTRYNGSIRFVCSGGTITASAPRNTVKMYQKLTNIKSRKSVKKTYVFNKACEVHLDKTIWDTDKYYNQQLNSKGDIFAGKAVKKGGKYYLKSGAMKAYHTMAKCKGKWYYYGTYGTRQSGFKRVNGNRYYFKPDRATGFRSIDGARYYFLDKKYKYYKPLNEGWMATGFKDISGKRYYFADSKLDTYKKENIGKMQTGFKWIKGKLYYFARKSMEGFKSADLGVMQRGWRKISGKKYYFKSNGTAAIGWATINGKRYYFDKNGVMQTGTLEIAGKIYHFDQNGVLIPESEPAETGSTADLPETEFAPEIEPTDGNETVNENETGSEGETGGQSLPSEDANAGAGNTMDQEISREGAGSGEDSSGGESVSAEGNPEDPVNPPADSGSADVPEEPTDGSTDSADSQPGSESEDAPAEPAKDSAADSESEAASTDVTGTDEVADPPADSGN